MTDTYTVPENVLNFERLSLSAVDSDVAHAFQELMAEEDRKFVALVHELMPGIIRQQTRKAFKDKQRRRQRTGRKRK